MEDVFVIYPQGYVAPPPPPPPTYPDGTYPLGFVVNITIVYNPGDMTLEQYLAEFRLRYKEAIAEAMGA